MKKIVPECFTELPEGCTRLLLQRHVAHTTNRLSPIAIAHCHIIGHHLSTSKVIISSAYCGPANRAHLTCIETQMGYGNMVYTHTHPHLSDMALEDSEHLDAIKARVEARGLKWGDPGIAEVAYDPTEAFIPIMTRRGTDGAAILKKIVEDNKGKTVLVTSHGVARIEVTLMVLKGETINKPERLVEEGQIIELIFNHEGSLIEEHWLEAIPAPTAPKPPAPAAQ